MSLSGKTRTSLPNKTPARPMSIQPPPNPVGKSGRRGKIGLVEAPNRLQEMPIEHAVAWSTGLHVAGPFIIWGFITLLFLLVLWLMNINLWDMLMPKPEKKADMVFALVQDRKQPKPKDAKMKGQFNQLAGGETDPNRPLTPLEQPSAASKPAQQPPKPQSQVSPPPQPQAQPQPKPQPPQPKPEPPQPKASDKTPPVPKPSFKPSIPLPSKADKIQPQPSPRPDAPTGPVASASHPSQASKGSPGPTQIPSQGALAMASPNSLGGNVGNAQGGKGAAGVDVEADVDYGPFMADLERRIKRNWNPPRSARSKRVQLKFYVQRDGRLVKVDLVRPSGDPLADEAAKRAVEVSAPFRSFPPHVKEDVLPIEFTFDYNVFNPQFKGASN